MRLRADRKGILMKGLITAAGVGAFMVSLVVGSTSAAAEPSKVPLVFSGGHETDPKDRGRPVVLVAAGLGVTPDVFREAFSGVTPARGRGPTGEEARRNKDALMKVLKPHGVTNDRLDEVSNYYRYRPQDGEMWPTTEAKGYALVADGKVQKFVITEPGSGYSSPPEVAVQGMKGVRAKAALQFSKDLKKNGVVASVADTPAK